MTNILKYDVVVVKFPFASSLKYKARPAVVVSSAQYNSNKRDTLLIMAITSVTSGKLDFEINVEDWQSSGLLKPSVFKASIATIENSFVLTKLGSLSSNDIISLDNMIKHVC